MTTQIDKAYIVIGLPGNGKSTTLIRESKAFLQQYPTGLVLAHDIDEQLVGAKISVAYENTTKWREAYKAARASGAPFPRAASFFDCSNEEVGALVMELAKRHNKAEDVRVPMFYALDENSESDTSLPTYQGKQDKKIWSRRRHLGVIPYLNTQLVTDVNVKFWRAVTDIVMFAQTPDQARKLEDTLGLPRHALDALINAPKFRYLLWRRGVGIVDTKARAA